MVFMAFLVACTDGKDTGTDVVGDAAAGEALYASNCASCHGADGTLGASGASDLTVEVPALDDAGIETIVLNGEGAMPAYDFDEQEMADILAYLRATFG